MGAADYNTYRPSYPVNAVSWLLGEDESDVVDLGAGTGILTRLVRDLGHRVVGIEPDDQMRLEADRTLPGIVRKGRAEAIPLATNSVDTAVAGQAWHWFDNARAQREVKRVVRPGGHLGLVSNLRDESQPWVARLGEIVGGEDRTDAAGAGEPPPLGHGLTNPEVRRFTHQLQLSSESVLKLVATWSFVAARPDRSEVINSVRELLTEPASASADGIHTISYVCVAIRAQVGD